MPVTISGTTGVQGNLQGNVTGNLTGQASELAPGGINNRTLITDLSSNDAFLFWDSTDQTLKKVEFNSMQPSGAILQSVTAMKNNYQAITSIINQTVDTIPTTSNGSEITGLSATITPSNANNKILVRCILSGSSRSDVITYYSIAVFRDAITNAVGAAFEYGASYTNQIYLEFIDSPSTTSPVTYRTRGGTQDGSILHINGAGTNPGTRRFGGVLRSVLTLQEIKG